MAVTIRTRYYPRTAKRPGRIVAVVHGGDNDRRKETFRWDGPGAHLRAAQRLAQLCGLAGDLVEVDFRDTGNTYQIAEGT